MKKNIEVNIEITPEEMAAMWCAMGSDEQARFLNEIGNIAVEWKPGYLERQMQYITDAIEIEDTGRWVMKLMGDYADVEPRKSL